MRFLDRSCLAGVFRGNRGVRSPTLTRPTDRTDERTVSGALACRSTFAVLVVALGLLTACSSNGASSSSTIPAAVESAPGGASTPAVVASVESVVSAPAARPSASAVASSPATVGSEPQRTTTTVDPGAPAACSLLTSAEIAFAAGGGATFAEGKADEPQETPYGAHTACTWTSNGNVDATVRVSVWDDPTAFDDAQQQLGSTGEITGVGDRAFSSTLSSIYAVADGHTLFIQFADLDRDDAANLAVTTAIAPLAVSRL